MAANMQIAVLVFLKSMATPVVLYSEDPQGLYEELKHLILAASPDEPQLIEKPGAGPLRKVSFLDTELAGCALQVDASAPPQGGGGGPQQGPRPAPGPGPMPPKPPGPNPNLPPPTPINPNIPPGPPLK